ncbi:MAG TPA: hypothetical protein VLB50_09440 [Ignavibacteriaceae bacterium]|nr:hypothetical protein [Ignavibacteriaceae bacterium]
MKDFDPNSAWGIINGAGFSTTQVPDGNVFGKMESNKKNGSPVRCLKDE